MEAQGLYPAFYPDLCKAIVRLMIERFNRALKSLQARHVSNFVHVDLTNTVGEDEWYDQEIHPNHAAAERLALKFAAYLGPLNATPVVAAHTPASKRRGAQKAKLASSRRVLKKRAVG